ncbi:MAG: DUF5663 domain-containing protein [Candidatus Saccharimonadaceae bacterium]|nr:DUF5663 domain-containing protein [Candidatus Saccharimonadaceae bacterium]
MFQLDEKFLNDLGLDSMPEEQKKPFLQHIYDELELRVGTKLSEGMTNEQLDEFESIIDRKEGAVEAWIQKNVPNYQTDETFLQLVNKAGLKSDDPTFKSEFVATKWLELNRPNYRGVVAHVLEEIKQEVLVNRDAILGSEISQS